jgi:hypothetical protein
MTIFCLGAEVGANIAILKMWRFMAAELNPRLGLYEALSY